MGSLRCNHFVRYSPKKSCRRRANQKFGMDRPRNAAPVDTESNQEYWRRAEYTPIPTPTISENTVATTPRRTVLARALWMSWNTGRCESSEMPQSPRTNFDSHVVYWLNSDLSRPNSTRRRARSFALTRGFTAYPATGSMVLRTTRKTRMLEMIRMGIANRNRRMMYRNIA